MKKHFLTWFAIWAGIALLVLLLAPKDKESILTGLALAASLSLFFMLKNLLQSWSGKIEEIFDKTYTSDDEDGVTNQKTVTFAKVLLTNGKTKKVHFQSGWKVGDKLQKTRGEYQIKVLT